MNIIEAIEFEDYEMEFRVDRQNHCESQDFSIKKQTVSLQSSKCW